jgi:hypothetical protein
LGGERNGSGRTRRENLIAPHYEGARANILLTALVHVHSSVGNILWPVWVDKGADTFDHDSGRQNDEVCFNYSEQRYAFKGIPLLVRRPVNFLRVTQRQIGPILPSLVPASISRRNFSRWGVQSSILDDGRRVEHRLTATSLFSVSRIRIVEHSDLRIVIRHW